MAGGNQRDGTGEAKPPEVDISIAKLPSLAQGAQLFGRVTDTAWLDACWAEGVNVASIVAFGGVGKSALVWDWLQRDGWRGAVRVYGWSFYSQGTTDRMTSADEFISAALRWFGDPDPNVGSPWDKGERLARLVKERRTFLVLDGVEPLQWGPGPEEGKIKDPALAALVRELGAKNPGMCVLTSRIAVREVEDFPREKHRRLDLNTLTEEAGAALLRARRVKGEEKELREAVREYGGHSLALVLLSSYLEEVGEGDVRRRHEIGPLVEDDRFGGHARRVMAAYERMFGSGSAEVAILRMLGLFDRAADEGEIAALRAHPPIAGLTVALAEVRQPKWNKALSRLRRMGLLAPATGQDKRLDAHPLVREHFGLQLQQSCLEAWQEGHRRLYEHLKGQVKKFPETIEEMAPLYAAVVHGCRAGKSHEALENVWWQRIHREDKGFSIRNLGAFGSEVAVLSALFEYPWERLAPGFEQLDVAGILGHVGFALRALGRLREAAGLMQMGLELRVAQANWKQAAVCAANVSELLQVGGKLSEALAQAQKSVALADKGGDAFLRGGNRAIFASILHDTGIPVGAARQFEEGELVLKDGQSRYPLLYSVQGFLYCSTLFDHGRDTEVLERAMQTLMWAEANDDPLSIALDHVSLGRARLLTAQRGVANDLALAATHIKYAVNGLRRAGRQEYLPLGLFARAALHTHTRDFDRARRDLDEALTLSTRYGFRLHEADAHLGHARLCLAEHDPAAALDHLATARKLIDETGYHRRDEEMAGLEAEAGEMAQEQRAERDARRDPSDPAKERREKDIMPSAEADQIRELHAAVVSAGLTRSRDALMAGIHRAFVDGITDAANPAAQVMVDLDALHQAGALSNGTVPLRIWLANAEQLAGGRAEAAVFARVLAGLPSAAPFRQAPSAPELRPEAMTPERLLDVLCNLLPAQLDALIFKLTVPTAYLSATTAPQATRSTEILRWAQQQARLADVARVLAEVTGAR